MNTRGETGDCSCYCSKYQCEDVEEHFILLWFCYIGCFGGLG